MSEGFQLLDIILLAVVAAFIALRLRSVLGRRTGHEGRPAQPLGRRGPGRDDNVIPLPDRTDGAADGVAAGDQDSPAAAGLAQIKIADRGFDTAGFLAGARAAYEMIIEAFAKGDTNALRPLLNDEVYENFATAIEERQTKKENLETTLVSVDGADIIAARMAGRYAEVTVKFVSHVIRVVRNAAGEIVDGDPANALTVTDIWTFSRNTAAGDPNWTLIETRSAT